MAAQVQPNAVRHDPRAHLPHAPTIPVRHTAAPPTSSLAPAHAVTVTPRSARPTPPDRVAAGPVVGDAPGLAQTVEIVQPDAVPGGESRATCAGSGAAETASRSPGSVTAEAARARQSAGTPGNTVGRQRAKSAPMACGSGADPQTNGTPWARRGNTRFPSP